MGRGAGRRGDLGAALPGQALAAGAALLVALDRGPALARRVAVEAGGRPVGDYVYQGLLAVLLRLALRLHAEARGLAPAGLAALRAELDEETCSNRHVESRGAWPRLLALLAAGDGDAGGPLDLGAFPFLADAALEDPATRSLVDALTRVDGRPVDYRRLELEQLGGLLEALTGQRVVASPSGRMSLEAGSERRRAGVHYTPRALAEQVARRTLAPALGRSPSASSILSLRVCDPAMGAGVFLLAACRLLARALVRAWRREGDPRAEAVDAEAQARRLVAGRCLYGVDRSPLAVALTGHALALASRSSEPPALLAPGLRCGDALVGLDRAELAALAPWGGEPVEPALAAYLDDVCRRAAALRQRARALVGRSETRAERARLAALASALVEPARLLGDLALAQAFGPPAARRGRRRQLAALRGWLSHAHEDRSLPPELCALAEPLRDRLAPLHWPLELPEALAAGGFDAIVGNPPFVGGRRISTTLGDDHARWLARRYDGSKNADLCAFFFRRAGELLAEDGAAGLLATNTIGQGDTRETGLAVLVERGAVIYDATAARAWPGDASVTLSIVHFARGEAARRAGRPRLDGAPVTAINSRLRPGAERPPPRRLPERRGESFQGTVVLGRGFLLTPAERDALVAEAPANAERIAPYVGGEEVNTSPTQAPRRHVIDFGALELHEAARWPTLLERLRRDVKPARDRVKRKALRERWWRHADHRPGLYEAVRGLSRCLVNSQVSRHLIFAFQPTGRVYAHTLYVYPFCDYARFALLQSRVHGAWARLLASTLGSAGLRYTSTDCFDTFPFPPARALAKGGALELAGAAAHALRAELAARRELGLTAIYNRLRDRACDDPAIARLRELHLELDRAALAAYELSITPPPYVAPRDADEARALAAFEEAVIDRLYALNAARG